MGCSRSKCTETMEIKTRDKERIVEEGKKEIKEEKEQIEENEDIIGDDIFGLPINYYSMPGEPHPPFENINRQIKTSLCRIEKENKTKGIGFFCKIPFPSVSHFLPVLITDNSVLKKEDILPEKTIKILLNNKKEIVLSIDNSRKVYAKNNIIIIEIKPNDRLNIKYFFDFINFNDCEEILSTYRSQSVISLLYSSEEKINCELGMLNYSKINNYKFVYITVPLVSILGSPIITLNTHKIIGIISDNGKFLINIIQDF